MSKVMLGLGQYRFSIDTAPYEELNRTANFRWEAQARFGRTPALQFVGPGEHTIELTGTMFPHFKGGLGQLDTMRAEAGKGEPLMLVSGRGEVLGKWCILEVTERQSVPTAEGAARHIEFTLRISVYGDDA